MIVYCLMLLPAVAGACAFFLRGTQKPRLLLFSAASAHLLLTAAASFKGPEKTVQSLFGLDAPGLLVLSITSLLFLMVSIYSAAWLPREHSRPASRHSSANQSDSVFAGCMLLFLAAMTTVTASQHMGILWVAIEATTLASAPLIYYHRNHRSLEATWKYLLICSVGIAMALLGNFFLVYSSAAVMESGEAPMLLSDLLRNAASLNHTWLKAAFIFLLIGYGTKMGLAPLHTWLPDAHSQAPSPASALLSGALLNCAFLGLFRAVQICGAAGIEAFSAHLLLVFGLLSMAWAAVFIIRQSDYKRMLAYSSIENMGIIAFGAGLGKAGLQGAFLHSLNHSLVKSMLFLIAGNLLYTFGSKRVRAVRGASVILPVSALCWLAGFFAISGIPPFGTFISKFSIIRAAMESGHYAAAAIFLLLLVIIFIGMAGVFLPMFFGSPSDNRAVQPEPAAAVAPAVLLCLAVLLLGLYVPQFLQRLIAQAAGAL